MLHAKEVKFVEVDNLYTGFRLCRKPLSSHSKRKLKNIIFECDVIMTSKFSYDTRPGMVINRAKFHHPKSNSFEGV